MSGNERQLDKAKAAPETDHAQSLREETFSDSKSDRTTTDDTASKHLTDGFEIVGNSPDPKKMEEYADQIEYAANGGITGLGTNAEDIKKILEKTTEEEFLMVDKIFTEKHGKNYASKGEKWDIRRELKDELSEGQYDRFTRIIDAKSENEIPEKFKVTGESLLKPGSDLKVGETNRMTLSDGRTYDVFVPRNMDSRAPVIFAMHGAGMGDGLGVMEAESGLNMDANQIGAIVVYPTPKPIQHETYGMTNIVTWGSTEGTAWNIPGRKNLPQAEFQHDDRDYIDNIKAHLGERIKTSEKIGMIGMSDGARFAQGYAADRPGNVAAISSIHGTWMANDRKPTEPVPIMIIHSDSDKTLPYEGGLGEASETMHNVLRTNLHDSKPFMQKQIWAEVNGCNASPEVTEAGDHKVTTFTNCLKAEVKEYIYKGNSHALHDRDNDGNEWIQWALGEPNRNLNLVSKSARFLKDHIVKG